MQNIIEDTKKRSPVPKVYILTPVGTITRYTTKSVGLYFHKHKGFSFSTEEQKISKP